MSHSLRSTLLCGVLAAIAVSTARGEDPVAPATAATAPAKTPDPRLDWWRDARFGLFIHWGLYAIPAGEWKGATHHGEWIRDSAQIPVEEYEKFKEQWNPTKFDAARWADIAAKAGMKYVVITTKHHDGFCLFDSAQTDWDVMSTPFKRDVMKEISDAFRAKGLKVCWYHSIMDWHHPDYLPRRPWETTRATDGADLERFVKYLHAEVEELLTHYGDIGVLWFDGEWESSWTHERGKALYELCRRLQPNLIVNNRVDVGREGMDGFSGHESFGDFGTPEQTIPALGFPGVDWETCMTMNGHWGFNRADHDWKSAHDMIRMLCDIASKGGNFLMNVGPTAEGEFPAPCVERLEAIGAWLKVNGEAIYGTRAGVFAELPWGRCTVKTTPEGTRLYLHVFEWPKDGALVVPGLGNDVSKAFALAHPDAKLAVTRKDADVVVSLQGVAPDADCTVIVLDISGASPIVYTPPVIAADSDGFVTTLRVEVTSATKDIELRATTDGAEPTLASLAVTGALVLDRSATVKARAFHAGKPVSSIVTRSFTKVAPQPARAPRQRLAAGLDTQSFNGAFDALPDFAALTPAGRRVAPAVALIEGERGENAAHRFAGLLQIGATDYWRFELTADDGARLWIDGALVIDNDGLHTESTKRGGIALAAGFHEIVIAHFNRTGDTALDVKMGKLGDALATIPAGTLVHEM